MTLFRLIGSNSRSITSPSLGKSLSWSGVCQSLGLGIPFNQGFACNGQKGTFGACKFPEPNSQSLSSSSLSLELEAKSSDGKQTRIISSGYQSIFDSSASPRSWKLSETVVRRRESPILPFLTRKTWQAMTGQAKCFRFSHPGDLIEDSASYLLAKILTTQN